MFATSNFKRKGFTLIELIIVVFVLAIGILGVYSVYSQIISYTTISLSRLTASYLAQEGIEIVRNIRDTNWLEGESNPWDEGLTSCLAGCEADYFCTTVEEPAPDNPISHNCFKAYGTGNFLKIDPTNGFYNYATGDNTKFKREITITPIGNILKVSVTVSWQEKGKPYNITAQENLYNWYKQ